MLEKHPLTPLHEYNLGRLLDMKNAFVALLSLIICLINRAVNESEGQHQ